MMRVLDRADAMPPLGEHTRELTHQCCFTVILAADHVQSFHQTRLLEGLHLKSWDMLFPLYAFWCAWYIEIIQCVVTCERSANWCCSLDSLYVHWQVAVS